MRFLARCALILLVCAAAACVGWPRDAVEAAPAWSKPQLLFSTAGYAGYPLAQADTAGDVHLIFMTLNQHKRDITANTQGTLMYARLHDGVWSTPIDVLVTPGGGPVNLPSTTLDDAGYLHVVWQGGFNGYIYYSRAHVSEAGSARGWTKPEVLSNGGASGSSIFAASDGRLHFVYASIEGVLYYRQSTNGGQTWSAQTTLVDTRGTKSQVDFPRVAADDRGRTYVTWNQYQLPDAWPSVGAFTMRSLDAGDSWLPVVRVAPQDYGFITVQPTSSDTVYRVWNSTADLKERRYQVSGDGGQSWSTSQFIPTLEGGFSGPPALAVDSLGTLHILTATAPRKLPLPQGIFEVTLSGTELSDPQYVSTGVEGTTSVEQPSVTIAQGDRVYAAWEQDFTHIWVADRRLGTPKIASRPVPAPGPTAVVSDNVLAESAINGADYSSNTTAQPTAAAIVAATPAPRPTTALPPAPPAPVSMDPAQALLVTFVPSLLLVLIVVFRRLMRPGA